MKLLPLGSVIKVRDHKVCIIGYSSVEREAQSVCGYLVVVYPLGFTNIDKTFFIPHNEEFELVAEGYATAPSEAVLKVLANSFEMAQKLSVEDLQKVNEAYRKVLLSKKEAEGK